MAVIKAKGYNIYLSDDIVDEVNRFFSAKKYKNAKCVILVDSNTHTLCLDEILSAVDFFHNAEIIEVDCGEESKSIEVCDNIWNLLLDYEFDKNAVIVNVGGGVVSDLGGFIASTYKRGVEFVNISTSLLSMVDASIGGKVAINIGKFKNQIGAFYNPSAVFIHTNFLNTLEQRQLNSGLAEMLKHGLISDAAHLENLTKSIKKNKFIWNELILQSISIKNAIVMLDPKEKSTRKSLNFGHTIGHAIESFLLEQGVDIFHGEAILFALIAEMYISNKILGFVIPKEFKDVFAKLKLPTIKHFEFEKLLPYLIADKKNSNGQINFTLIDKIGNCKIDNFVDITLISESIDYLNAWLF